MYFYMILNVYKHIMALTSSFSSHWEPCQAAKGVESQLPANCFLEGTQGCTKASFTALYCVQYGICCLYVQTASMSCPSN